MEAIGDAFKPLFRGLMGEPDSDQIARYLAWTRTIKSEAVKAREHAPAMTEKMSAADREALVTDYQADMDVFIQQVEALEKALVAGNLTEAQALVQKLKGARRDGHGKYQEEEE
jgi:soluble cytochrome b562